MEMEGDTRSPQESSKVTFPICTDYLPNRYVNHAKAMNVNNAETAIQQLLLADTSSSWEGNL